MQKYVSLNGGIADNIRPALYGARYEALVANKMDAEFAVLVSGAYCLSMASNYNFLLKPAVVLVGDGKARLIRETYLIGRDVASDRTD